MRNGIETLLAAVSQVARRIAVCHVVQCGTPARGYRIQRIRGVQQIVIVFQTLHCVRVASSLREQCRDLFFCSTACVRGGVGTR